MSKQDRLDKINNDPDNMQAGIEPYDKSKLTCLFTQEDMRFWEDREKKQKVGIVACVLCRMHYHTKGGITTHIRQRHKREYYLCYPTTSYLADEYFMEINRR